MAELTEKQQQALDLFKEKVKDTILEKDNNDAACLRFLRARQYDVDKTLEMYNNYAKWRKEAKVDDVLNEKFPVARSKWVHSFHGKDKTGRPIYIEVTGSVNIKAFVEKDKKTVDELVRGHIRNQEVMSTLCERNSKEEGKLIENSLTILDIGTCSVWTHLNGYARQFFGAMAQVGQNYYPERMGKMVVLNAPRAFPMAWNFIKGFLDTNTQNKIEVFSNTAQGHKRLAELVDLKYLPKVYGGECDCEANGCYKTDPPGIGCGVDEIADGVANVDLAENEEPEEGEREGEGDEEYEEGEK